MPVAARSVARTAVKLKPVVLRRVVRRAVREKSPNDRVDCGAVSSSLFAEASENNDVDPLELCFCLQTPKLIASASDINDGAHITPFDDGTLATDFTVGWG